MESRGAPKALEGPHIIVSLAMQTPIGFLGFGEAGFHLARGLRGAGAPQLLALTSRHLTAPKTNAFARALRRQARASSRRPARSLKLHA
jgi:3-hydroxyisobutyrate dehydrogenase-like beta-hydroxyacid dehydrogenase